MKSNRSIFNFILTITLTLFLANFAAYAVPAKGGVIKVKQADGTEVEVKICGDEWFNWRTTTDGYPVAEKSGFVYYAQYNSRGEVAISDQKVMLKGRKMTPPSGYVRQDVSQIAPAVAAERQAMRSISSFSDAQRVNFPCQGKIRSAIILVEYADLEFVTPNPNEAFHNQLNEKDYSVAGATGSAKDYFAATSGGQFDGQFDVYGPYKLSKNRSYYGGNDYSGSDKCPDLMVKEAAELAHADGMDFSLYDYNEDGFVDNIFVYYAGHNEAEGGSSESVWPHKWSVSSRPRFDGKVLYEYACTSELRGASGSTIAGIGTFCHEFSHVFGLADHYDTDYYTNGYSYGLGDYDIMSSGSYNNDGNTPPLHNALELDMIGWATPTVIDQDQSITLQPIQNLETYKILTEVDGEYFLLENRNTKSIVWDKYIPSSGLIISHIDRSKKYMSYWGANAPNKNPNHECFKFVNAGNAVVNDRDETSWKKVPYPYNSNDEWSSTSTPRAQSWGRKTLDYKIMNITRSGYNINFYASSANYDGLLVNIIPENSDFYVGESTRFNAAVLPEGNDQKVTWSSSDDSIATVSSDGVVEFLAVGEVKITAVCVDDPASSGSYVVNVENFQGARGVITDSDNNILSKTTLSLYYTERVVGQMNVVSYTRSMNKVPIIATTDEKGFYRLPLSEGYYEVEISEGGYEDLFMIINIEAGSNLVNFEVNSFAESVEVNPAQTTAILKWNSGVYQKFKVTYQSTNGTPNVKTATSNEITLDELEPFTTYSVTIAGSENGKTTYVDMFSTEFTTYAKTTSMPFIKLPSYDYAEGDLLELEILNGTSSDDITWYYDGEEVNRNKVILDSGEHMITCRVKRGDSIYRVARYINVK